MEQHSDRTPCDDPLPDLETQLINTMISCLGNEHRRLDRQTLQLALAATRLAVDPESVSATKCATEAWTQIRGCLWPHLQIEDELVLSWGDAHHALSGTLLESLKNEREHLRNVLASLPAPAVAQPRTVQEQRAFAHSLMVLAGALDSHIERYDREALPAILRALFRRQETR